MSDVEVLYPWRSWVSVDRDDMQKKQYEQLAKVLKEIDTTMALAVPLPEKVHNEVMEHVCARIGLMLAKDNPAFDSFRFYAATGLARFRESADLPSR